MEKETCTLLELPIRPLLTSWTGKIFGTQGDPGHGREGPCGSEEGQVGGAVFSGPLGRGGWRTSAGLSPRPDPLCG